MFAFEVGWGDTGNDVSRLGARRLRLSSVRKPIHNTRQLVTRIATAAYSELISPKGRRKMKRAASNNEGDAVVFGVAGQHQNSNQPTSSLGKPHSPQVQ